MIAWLLSLIRGERPRAELPTAPEFPNMLEGYRLSPRDDGRCDLVLQAERGSLSCVVDVLMAKALSDQLIGAAAKMQLQRQGGKEVST